MEPLITSFGLVALAELGDKTLLLSFLLAARFRGRHWAIIAGILCATLFNHLCAAFVGDWFAAEVRPEVLRWVLGLAFLGFAAWALIPDRHPGDRKEASRYGAFATTLVMFFLAEMGDKTQLATIALGAKYASLAAVAAGTTLGMMAANIPAVLIGGKLAERFPLSRMRFIAAALFALFGVLILLQVDFGLGLSIGKGPL